MTILNPTPRSSVPSTTTRETPRLNAAAGEEIRANRHARADQKRRMSKSTPEMPSQSISSAPAPQQTLRLLSYNIQAGIAMSNYSHYLTRSWQHLLPHPERVQNLNAIAQLINDFDIVGLQEADAGSLRSGFINLTEYLGIQAGFPYWYDQTNRNLGKFAQHSLGFLSRFCPSEVREHRLPGVPGRGVLVARYGYGSDALAVMIMHLALGKRARLRQFGYVGELLQSVRHAVVMGDLNCRCDSDEMRWFMSRSGLREPTEDTCTYPSWRPNRTLDHILVSPSLRVKHTRVLSHLYSDHLPVTMEVVLPEEVRLQPMRPELLRGSWRAVASA